MKTTPADKSRPVVENAFWLRFEFRLRRVGFVILLLIVFAAMTGFFSRGYLSNAQLSSTDQRLVLNYERFNRLTSDAELKIISNTSAGKPNRIVLAGDFMDSFRIDNLQPQPDAMYSQNGKMIIEYQAQAAAVKQTLWFSVTPMKAGVITSTIAVDNSSPLTFRQFVYP